jgi:hypothetical protein
MAFLYRRGPQDFFQIGPVNEIRETQYGNALGAHIYYPGVSTCTTITLLLTNGTALGMHLTKLDLATDVDAIVTQVNAVRGGTAVSSMYAVGVLRCRDVDGWMGVARYRWPVQLSTFNTAFGRAGGDIVQGFIQKEGSGANDYRVLVGGGGVSWYVRPQGTHTWNNLDLETL